MGDAAIDAVLDEFADQEGWLGDLPSVRIEHATLFTPAMVERVRAARLPGAVRGCTGGRVERCPT